MSFIKGETPNFTSKESIATSKLEEIRKNGVQLLGFDYDGTVIGDEFGHPDVTSLILQIARAGVVPAVITARDATIKVEQIAVLEQATRKEQIDTPIYIATANGASLFKIQNGESEQVYSNDLTQEDLDSIITAYSSLGIPISEEMDKIRQASLKQDWEKYIPPALFKLSLQNKGVWVEPSKVTLRLPEAREEQQQATQELTQKLPNLAVAWGGKPLADVTKRLEFDGKLHVVQFLMNSHNIPKTRVATFGDTPDGNDKMLLSLPYSFTNREAGLTAGIPYMLSGTGSPVSRVHEAINFVLPGSKTHLDK